MQRFYDIFLSIKISGIWRRDILGLLNYIILINILYILRVGIMIYNLQCIFNESKQYPNYICCPSARSAFYSKENHLYYRKTYYLPWIVFNTKIMVFIIHSHYAIIISSSRDKSLLVGVNLLSMVMLFATPIHYYYLL